MTSVSPTSPGALADRGRMKSISFSGPVDVEVDLLREHMAENPLLLPGTKRVAARTVGYGATDFPTAYRVIHLIMLLASVQG